MTHLEGALFLVRFVKFKEIDSSFRLNDTNKEKNPTLSVKKLCSYSQAIVMNYGTSKVIHIIFIKGGIFPQEYFR